MTFWQFIDRYLDRRAKRGRSSERQWITVGIFTLIGIMLAMARENPALWNNETFKDLLKIITTTGLLNMILAFHFAANKGDEQKTENTRAAFEAIRASARQGTAEPDVTLKPGETAQAER